MGKKSLRACEAGIKKATQARFDRELTQEKLAPKVPLSRSTVDKFFNGENVQYDSFLKICNYLKLNWKEIAEEHQPSEQSSETLSTTPSRDEFQTYLLNIVNHNEYKRHSEFYTPTDVVDKPQQVDMRLLVRSVTEGEKTPLPVLEGIRKYAKNHVLLVGKPGSGKSTALRRLLWEEAGNLESKGDGEDEKLSLGVIPVLPNSLEIIACSEEDAIIIAKLRPLTKSAGLSLGDRACIALGKRLNLAVLTADKVWSSLCLGITINLVR